MRPAELGGMHLTRTQQYVIEARLNAIYGACEYDRLFNGLHIGALLDGILDVYVCGEAAASEVERLHLPVIAILVEAVADREIVSINVLPRMMGSF